MSDPEWTILPFPPKSDATSGQSIATSGHCDATSGLQKILEDCDKDHSETITFDEFKQGMKSYMEFFLHDE